MSAPATARPADARRVFSGDFDDLTEGLPFESRGRTVTEADVVAFAALTGDMHPQHVDADWAATSLFGERVAHGMLVLSYAVGLVNVDPERIVALRRLSRVTFKAPVRLGDTIRVRGRIERAVPLDDSVGLVESSWRVVGRDDRTVASLRIEVLWRRSATGQRQPHVPATAR